jgi:hypothetical protein
MRIHMLWIAAAAGAVTLATPADAGGRNRSGITISIGTGYYGGYYPAYAPVAYYGYPYYAPRYYGSRYYGKRYYRKRHYARRAYVRPYGYWSYYVPARRYYRYRY